jgi:predicted metalloprotease with PDZ domain
MCRTAGVLVLMLTLIAAAAPSPQGQSPRVEYIVTLDQPQTQFVSISVLVRGVRGEHIDFMLPVWRPGRYVVMNQAQSIRDMKASGEGGQTLAVEKTDKSTWRVKPNGSRFVRVDYRVYANSLNDRTRHVDDTHAFLSGAAVFMYSPDFRHEPCHVRIEKPAEWKIACGLDPIEPGANVLRAANYDVLVDSPLEIGVHDTLEFEVAGKPHQIVIWGQADYKADELKRDFAKIVEEQTTIFGSAPYQRYLFIIHVGAGGAGGTEHVNSTIMQTSRAALEEKDTYRRFLGLVSHEFFHTWNVKSFRPSGIHPYDYQRENYTKLLWVAEGTTSYYDDLVLVRAGFIKPDRYLETLSKAIDAMRNRPSEIVQSVEQASFDAWIQFAAHSPDDVNAKVDFYSKGALVSLLIDMEMRRRIEGKANLDHVMRAMFERFPLSGPGYTAEDLQEIIEELSGADFDDVFEKHVRGAAPLDLEQALEIVGVELYFKAARDEDEEEDENEGEDEGDINADKHETPRDAASAEGAGEANHEADPNDAAQTQPAATEPAATEPAEPRVKAYLGLNLTDADGRTTVSSVLADGPAFAAGVLAGDEILALDGRRLTAATLDARLKNLKPGQTITLTTFRREQMRAVEITLAGKADGKWTLRRVEEPSDAQKAAYAQWLRQKWPE